MALAGDPRASNQAIQGVYAAGLASGAAGDAAEAGEAGLKFFAELNKAKGNFVPVIGKAASLAQGATPIIIRWDYNALSDRDTLNGNPPVEVVVPKTGVVAGVYVQAISAFAPHPNAAKLWMEYLYSDEGQLGWLKGYCHPIRFNDLAKNGKIPQDLLDKLPPAAAYEKAVFPTLDEQNAGEGGRSPSSGTASSAPTSSSHVPSGPAEYRAAVLPRAGRDAARRIRRPESRRWPAGAGAGSAPRRARRRRPGLARGRAVLPLRADVPDPADARSWWSARSRTPRATSRSQNIANLFQPSILSAYWISIQVSAASALGGGADRLPARLGGGARAACRAGSGRR